MDFGAYLASSSSEGSDDDEGEGPSGHGQVVADSEGERILKYKVSILGVDFCLHLKMNLFCCRRCLRNVERTEVKVVPKKRWRSYGNQVMTGDDVHHTNTNAL